jgi:hypothetical protein
VKQASLQEVFSESLLVSLNASLIRNPVVYFRA